MDGLKPEVKTIWMRCPKCRQVIEVKTTETMVYCIACRKWCREEIDLKRNETANQAGQAQRKGIRCH